MLQFSKTYCHIHPTELIANFCTNEQCLMGLCATCICEHTQQHLDSNTTPSYENIRTTYSRIQDDIKNKLSNLEVAKGRIGKVSELIRLKRTAVRQSIQDTKAEILTVVEEYFRQRQEALMRLVDQEEKKSGLHSETRLDTLLNSLSRQLSNLMSASQQLNSMGFLDSYRRVRCHILGQSEQFYQQLSKEIEANENFDTYLSFNNLVIPELKGVLEKALTISFNHASKPATLNRFDSNSKLQTLLGENSHPTRTTESSLYGRQEDFILQQQQSHSQYQNQSQQQSQNHNNSNPQQAVSKLALMRDQIKNQYNLGSSNSYQAPNNLKPRRNSDSQQILNNFASKELIEEPKYNPHQSAVSTGGQGGHHSGISYSQGPNIRGTNQYMSGTPQSQPYQHNTQFNQMGQLPRQAYHRMTGANNQPSSTTQLPEPPSNPMTQSRPQQFESQRSSSLNRIQPTSNLPSSYLVGGVQKYTQNLNSSRFIEADSSKKARKTGIALIRQ